MDAVADAVHPATFVTLYVIVAEPAATPVTTPVVLTVATALLLDDHVPPVVELANVVDNPSQTFDAPVIAATTGNGLTVTTIAVEVAEQPLALVTVYEPLVVAVMDCVCNPFDHKYVEPVLAVKTTEPPAQNVVAPPAAIVADADGLTVTDAVVDVVHPLALVTLYVIVTKPDVTPDTTPVVLTVATALLLDDQVPPVVELANVVVEPVHTFDDPVIAATTGNALTVTGVATDVAEHPLAFVTVTV